MQPSYEPLRVLAICGSLRPDSNTRKALRIALTGAAEAGAVVRLADLTYYDLGWNAHARGLEAKGSDFNKLRLEIRFSQGLILGSPEYHGGYSGALKNALDQFEIDDFSGKVVSLVGVSGGRLGAPGALAGLRQVAKTLKTLVLPEEVSVAQAGKAFAADGRAADPALHQRLLELGANTAKIAALHAGAAALPREIFRPTLQHQSQANPPASLSL